MAGRPHHERKTKHLQPLYSVRPEVSKGERDFLRTHQFRILASPSCNFLNLMSDSSKSISAYFLLCTPFPNWTNLKLSCAVAKSAIILLNWSWESLDLALFSVSLIRFSNSEIALIFSCSSALESLRVFSYSLPWQDMHVFSDAFKTVRPVGNVVCSLWNPKAVHPGPVHRVRDGLLSRIFRAGCQDSLVVMRKRMAGHASSD